MKTDLDALMQANNLDALLITGSAQHNPAMVYLTGGAHFTGDLIKKRGQNPVLFYNAMERDEAAKTGLPTKNLGDYNFPELLKRFNGDTNQALSTRYQSMLADLGITSGRVAIYGLVELGAAFAIFNVLQEKLPEITLVGEPGNNSTILQARATKDVQEVDRIRQMGNLTTQVVAEVANFLTSHRVKDGTLVKRDGEPLTIGEVKSRIDLWLTERGVENPEGTIFAIGRDAGVPHSSGNPVDVLRLGQTIVFDIYPCEKGGGYFFDFTRTWCLGYAPDEVMALYDDVLATYRQLMGELRLNGPCKDYQLHACELFEARGHPTIRQDPKILEGYVHSLGHGVGLNVHERPWFSANATANEVLEAGSIFTVEPGLYYPEKGMGVRLEDTAWARPDGKMEILAEYPLDLVLPVK